MGVKKLALWWPKNVKSFEEFLQTRDRVTYDIYRAAQKAVMKHTVKIPKRMADWRWGERMGHDFEGNKEMFWREVYTVQRVRKGEQARDEMVKDM